MRVKVKGRFTQLKTRIMLCKDYEYWSQIATQIPRYENGFIRLKCHSHVLSVLWNIGDELGSKPATQKKQEAEIMQEQAAERIKQIAKETFNIDINTGKSGKTNEVKSLMFDYLKIPIAKYGKTGASLDRGAYRYGIYA